jgi:hypothetical protein
MKHNATSNNKTSLRAADVSLIDSFVSRKKAATKPLEASTTIADPTICKIFRQKDASASYFLIPIIHILLRNSGKLI